MKILIKPKEGEYVKQTIQQRTEEIRAFNELFKSPEWKSKAREETRKAEKAYEEARRAYEALFKEFGL